MTVLKQNIGTLKTPALIWGHSNRIIISIVRKRVSTDNFLTVVILPVQLEKPVWALQRDLIMQTVMQQKGKGLQYVIQL